MGCDAVWAGKFSKISETPFCPVDGGNYFVRKVGRLKKKWRILWGI